MKCFGSKEKECDGELVKILDADDLAWVCPKCGKSWQLIRREKKGG